MNNYSTHVAGNFGLGTVSGNLTNFGGGFLSAKGMGHNASNMSAYVTNASDLIRGFKSSQSIPIVTSAKTSIHQVSH